ncbi:MAG: hypothetical protein HY324_03195 [Chlamydiia bacterium]|nr:hypothetical protein [Chlamydiia bacterium]
MGPEIYHFARDREGGTYQNGLVDGVRLSIDRLQGCSWYLGVDYLYGSGEITGSSATGAPLRSTITDRIFEARLGFTLNQKYLQGTPFFTPFVGWGHFHEVNAFSPPSALLCIFTDSFNYVAVGFLSGTNFSPLLSMGINFKLRFMQEATSKVSNDPLYDHVTLMMGPEMHVRVDVPCLLSPCHTLLGMRFLLAPFFEYRHFGGREGFPFDFRDTKFYLYGARIALAYDF